MEVTRKNFNESFEFIKECIHAADFISFDTEFSGYSACKQDRGHDYDLLEERYQKLKYACQRFKALQIGISTFTWDEKDQRYIVKPFNFYVMNYSKIFDGVYSVRSDCLFFLSDHNFDFNKLYKEGITFQRLSDKESMIDKLKSSSYLDWSVWSKRDKNCLSKAKQLEVNKKASEDATNSLPQSKKKGVASSKSEETKEELVEKVEINQETSEDLLIDLFNRELGFSRVVEEMIKAQKPLIGHNQIYDIGFFYDQFIAPLPDTFLEFTEKWRECFPDNYDTKVIALNTKLKLFRKTDLESLYKTCRKDATIKEEVKFEIDKDPNFAKYQGQIDYFNNEEASNCLHEAGFDSLMTGIVFACLTKHKELLLELKNISTQAGKGSQKNKERQMKKEAKRQAKMEKNKNKKKTQENNQDSEETKTETTNEEKPIEENEQKDTNLEQNEDKEENKIQTEEDQHKRKKNKSKKKQDNSQQEIIVEENKNQSSNGKIKIGMNGQDRNLVLLNFKGRYFNFKESFDGIEETMDMTNVIWIKWGNPINGTLSVFCQDSAPDKLQILSCCDLCESLSSFGDFNIVKDSEVSCFVKFISIDHENINGAYNKQNPFSDINVLRQIEKAVCPIIETKFKCK